MRPRFRYDALYHNPELLAKHKEENLPYFLDVLEQRYASTPGAYALGDRISYVDYLTWQMIHDERVLEKLESYNPNLNKFSDALVQRENIKEYFASSRHYG